MDYLLGVRGKDFVMVVSDTTAVQQIITIKHDEVNIPDIGQCSLARQLNIHALALGTGPTSQQEEQCTVVPHWHPSYTAVTKPSTPSRFTHCYRSRI
jgi:hypothetical protein